MIIEQLLVALGFELDDDDLKEFAQQIEKANEKIQSFAKYTAGAIAALGGLMVVSAKATDEQGKLADEIGDAVENIDALQFAANRAGASSEQLTDNLRDLAIRAAEFSRGEGSGKQAFQSLGIAVKNANGELKGATDLFVEIAARMEGLSETKQVELADKLGLKNSLRLLQQGPKEIRALMAEAEALGVTTAEDARIAAEFEDSMTNAWTAVKDFTRQVAAILLPVMTENLEKFTDWWKINKEIIESNLEKWIGRITTALKILGVVFAISFGASIVVKIMTIIKFIRTATLAMAALNVTIAAIPILIGLAVAAFLLLLEDAYHFFAGNESFIGDMLEKYPTLKAILLAIGDVFKFIAKAVGMVYDGWKLIAQIIGGAVAWAIDGLKTGFDKLLVLIDKLVQAWERFKASIKEPYDKTVQATSDAMTSVAEAIGLQKSFEEMEAENNAQIAQIRLKRTLSNLSQINLETMMSGGTGKTSGVTVNEMKLQVNSNSASPKAVANEVMKTFQQATQDLQTAVDQ